MTAILVLVIGFCASESYGKLTTYVDPTFNPSSYRTFTVSLGDSPEESTPVVDLISKHMLVSLANTFQSLGYAFVYPGQPSDIIVTVKHTNERVESYVPPRSYTVYDTVPEQKIKVHDDQDYLHQYDTTITVPAQRVPRTETSPGYTVGTYYPTLSVVCFDTKTKTPLWTGVSATSSRDSDIRISSSNNFVEIGNAFPKCAYSADNYPTYGKTLGIALRVCTDDGNYYYPTIDMVARKSLAARAGLKRNDTILSIDGVPAQNKFYWEIFALLFRNDDAPLTLQIQRGKKTKHIILKTVTKPPKSK